MHGMAKHVPTPYVSIVTPSPQRLLVRPALIGDSKPRLPLWMGAEWEPLWIVNHSLSDDART